jgi:DNA-binding MarR family transcriptional regulator
LTGTNGSGTDLSGFFFNPPQGSTEMRNPKPVVKPVVKPSLAKIAATTQAIHGESSSEPFGGLLAQQHITVLLVSIGLRLNRGATAYYRAAWDLGMAEWRLLLVLSSTEALNVGELSEAADLDKAAVSRSLVLLEERKLVSVAQTRTRGRAAIAKLTAEGKKLAARLMQVSLQRQARLFRNFTKADKDRLNGLLHQLSQALDGADWDH